MVVECEVQVTRIETKNSFVINVVQVIVMACNEQEAGKHKCECYWTPDLDGPRQYGQCDIFIFTQFNASTQASSL